MVLSAASADLECALSVSSGKDAFNRDSVPDLNEDFSMRSALWTSDLDWLIAIHWRHRVLPRSLFEAFDCWGIAFSGATPEWQRSILL